MSWKTTAGLIVTGWVVSGLLHDVWGQVSDPGLCRRQCEAEMKFYQKFWKPEYLTGMSRQCLSQCPEPQTALPDTATNTTNPTATTTTATTESTPGLTTSASSTTTATTSTQKPGLECGLQKAGTSDDRHRIVGGVEAAPCEFPWLVFISILHKTCAGAILGPRHVLTAAHCVLTDNTQVRTQVVHVRAGSSSVSLAQVFPVVAITIHPLHDPANQINDAAILTVARDMPYSDCLGPICLPEPGAEARGADICVVAGWGTTAFGGTGFMPNLLKVELPIVDQDKCQDKYGQDRVNDRTFCAGDYYSGGRDSCQGDSGAPLMCRVRSHYFVYGIVSTGRNCAKPRLPGIYTKVGHPDISRFIQQTVDHHS